MIIQYCEDVLESDAIGYIWGTKRDAIENTGFEIGEQNRQSILKI
jgi:hypothetical protein